MPILCMSYDPSGTLIATGSADKTVKVYDIEKGHCTHLFRSHSDVIQRLYFHPDLNQLKLFSSSDDHSICVYDLRDSECIAIYKEHYRLPTSLSITDNGYILASGGKDKVRIMTYLYKFVFNLVILYYVVFYTHSCCI